MTTRYQAALMQDEILDDYSDTFDTASQAVSAAKEIMAQNPHYTHADIEETKTVTRVTVKRAFREEKVK